MKKSILLFLAGLALPLLCAATLINVKETAAGTVIGLRADKGVGFHGTAATAQRSGSAQTAVTAASTNGTAAATAPGAATSTNGTLASQAPDALTSTDGVAAAASADLAALAAEAEKIGDDVRALHAKYTLLVAEAEKAADDARAAHAAIILLAAEGEKIGDDTRATIVLDTELRAALVAKGLIKGGP